MIWLIVCIIISYILGSIPTSLIISRLWQGIDIRKHGSGNAGFTNVARILGWKPAVIVLITDVFKGFFITYWIARYFAPLTPLPLEIIQILSGAFAVIGHIWTIFAGFKGGKGVLTAIGMFLALVPLAAIICMVVGGLMMLIFRYVSLGSITGGLCLPVIVGIQKYILHQPVHNILMLFSIFIALLIVFTHRSNIQRLLTGNENRIGRMKVKE